MAITKIGFAEWGVATNIASDLWSQGVVTDFEESEEFQMAQQFNELGAICRQVVYDTIKTARVTVEVPLAVKLPKKGVTIQIGSQKYIVKSVTIVESNNAYRKFSVVCEASENVDTVKVVS